MSSKKRRGRRKHAEPVYGPVKPTPEDEHDYAEQHEIIRLLGMKRRPEHVALFRKYYSINLNRRDDDLTRRQHAKTNPTVAAAMIEADIQRDLVVRSLIRGSDTVMYFAGEKFCDLLEATDSPDVTDISVLRKIGNHTAMILYGRNVSTGNEDDSLVAVSVHMSETHIDGIPRLLGSIIHEDDSISTFMYKFHEFDDGLATVAWSTGAQERTGDLSTEEKLISNTLGLLAQQSVFTVTEWNHYNRTAKTAAARGRYKLPKVNVLGLTKYVQKDLDEHHEAVRIERDFCWPVRGHFRKQAYGTERKMRRLKYIRPHVKGNLDGPLVVRPQVHAAK